MKRILSLSSIVLILTFLLVSCGKDPKIEKGEWKRVLFIPTGVLLSKVSYNEGNSVPGIAQAVVIEHC